MCSSDLQSMQDSMAVGLRVWDLQGFIRYVNPAFCNMVGYKPEELIGKTHHETLHHSRLNGKPYSEDECPISATFNDAKVHKGDDQMFWRKDGTSFLAEYTCVPIIEDGNARRIIAAVFQAPQAFKQNCWYAASRDCAYNTAHE